ncbi:phasin family protein [Micromonospora sp. GCM10011542]|uniref:phasin family protein n=1 Tax=Micromonospora sp. GCM10011542 TaxID=3317337 RepID=UPI00360AA044
MQDAWRAYLELAMGLTEAPRKKAQDVARRLVGSGGATAAQLQALGEELVSTGTANREALTKLVRFEVDRALGAVGLATADEVAELTRRVHDLERQLREARTGGSAGTPAQPAGPAGPRPDAEVGVRPEAGLVPSTGSAAAPVSTHPARKAVAKKAVAKKAIVKKPPATVTRTSTHDPATPATPAKKAVRKRQPGGDA